MLFTIATLGFLLTVKHAICDLAIQRLDFMYTDKSVYLDKIAHLHAFHHGVGTFLVFLIIGPTAAIAFGLADYLIHWHIDYVKANIRKRMNVTDNDYMFWILQTIDQALHFTTYYVFVLLTILWLL